MSQAKYTVHYVLGTYDGDVTVYADEDADTDHVIAKAKRIFWRDFGPRPIGLYAESWRVTGVEQLDENPGGKSRKKPPLDKHEREVLGSLEVAQLDYWDRAPEEQTRQYFQSDGALYKAAKRLVRRKLVEIQEEGTYQGNKWIRVSLTEKGARAWRSAAPNPGKLKQGCMVRVFPGGLSGLLSDEDVYVAFQKDGKVEALIATPAEDLSEIEDAGYDGKSALDLEVTRKQYKTLLKKARRTDNPAKRRRNGSNTIVVAVMGPHGQRVERVVHGAEMVDDVFVIHPSMRNLKEIEEGEQRRPSSWGITHVPTGQLVTTLPSKDWARKLSKQIIGFSDEGLDSSDVITAANAMGGPRLVRAQYMLHVYNQSQKPARQRGKFVTYAAWKKTKEAKELAKDLETNPRDLATDAAVAAAVGSLVGGIIGAVGGGVAFGVVGGTLGLLSGGPVAGAGTAMVGAIFGIPVGAYVGTIWGAVRQTDKALEGYDATSARVLAGLGAALTGPLAPVGAGVGAYLGTPE